MHTVRNKKKWVGDGVLGVDSTSSLLNTYFIKQAEGIKLRPSFKDFTLNVYAFSQNTFYPACAKRSKSNVTVPEKTSFVVVVVVVVVEEH